MEDFSQEKISFCKSYISYYKSFLVEVVLVCFLEGKGTLCLSLL